MYTDRLREMVYTSPSGQSFELLFDDVSEQSGKKAPATEFPGRNIGQVQDLGQTIRRYPIDCYISGPDYDLQADRFRQALSEKGPGVLVHPRYGDLSVLPISVEVSENFVQGSGRASFSIEFLEVNETQTFPRINFAPSAILGELSDNAVTSIIQDVSEVELDTEQRKGLVESTKTVLNGIKSGFATATAVSQDLNNNINREINKIFREIDSLVLAPALLMESLLTIYRLPARILIDVETKINSYQVIYASLIDGFKETTRRYGQGFGRINNAQLSGILIGASESISIGDIPNRVVGLTNMERLALLRSNIIGDIQDSDFNMLSRVQVVSTEGILSLIKQSLSLPTEQILILNSDRNPIELTYELFGNLDQLELIIKYNDLQGDEILLIPKGREIRYYVTT